MDKKGSLDTRRPGSDWLRQALRISDELSLFEGGLQPPAVTAAFRERCATAAVSALGISRLARERSRVGFLPLSLSEYLKELARSARVELRPLLAAAGIGVEGGSTRSLPAQARLCRRLGLSLREALLHLGIGLAESLGAPPVPLVTARQDVARGGRDPLAAYEAALRGVLSEVDATGELQSLEAELRSVYEESSHGE